MGFKNDVSEYLSCETTRPLDEIEAAIRGAVSALGKHATISKADAQRFTVVILPGFSTKLSDRSPVVDISYVPSGSTSTVTTKIVDYITSQQAILWFIPAGPKSLSGRAHHRKFLDALETELVAIDHLASPRRGNRHAEASKSGSG